MKIPGVKPKTPTRATRYKYSILRREMTLAAQCHTDTLTVWQKKLALWLVDQVHFPTVPQLQQQAVRLTGGAKMSIASIKALVVNPVFRSFVAQCEEESVTQARAVAEGKVRGAVEKHFDAIDRLFDEGRYEHIAKFTNPVLERIWPVSTGPTQTAQIIQITVGAPGSFAAQNARLAQAIEVEAVSEVVADA